MGLVKQLFYQGNYSGVLEITLQGKDVIEGGDFSYAVGSLSFLGRIQEAEALFKANKDRIQRREKAYVYFFLALGWTRRSQYLKAKKYLILNRNLLNKESQDPEISFLIRQGISFFLHFLGRFESSLNWSEKALEPALADQDFWMRALAHDLMANNLVQVGRVHEGLQHFKLALTCSQKLKNQALIKAIEVSSLIYSC